MAAILDFRSCDIWEHFYVHKWIDHTPDHEIRHQDHLYRLNNSKVMLVFNFGYFGWRPYWIWPKKVPSRFFPPGILIDFVNRPPKGNYYEGFKTIPIFSRSNPIFMRLLYGITRHGWLPWKQGSWGPSGADRTQVGPMLAPWTLLSGLVVISAAILWSFVLFCDSTKVTWKMIKDEDDDFQSFVNIVAKYILGDCSNKNCDHCIIGRTKVSKWLADESMSNTKQLLDKLAMLSDCLLNLFICNILTSVVNEHPTPHHDALSVYFRRKKTMMHIHDYLAVAWEQELINYMWREWLFWG